MTNNILVLIGCLCGMVAAAFGLDLLLYTLSLGQVNLFGDVSLGGFVATAGSYSLICQVAE